VVHGNPLATLMVMHEERSVPKRAKKKAAKRTAARSAKPDASAGKRETSAGQTKPPATRSSRAAQRPLRTAAAPPRRPGVRETPEERQARAARLLKELQAAYPDATCALHHDSALKLLVATILSAQCTDERVNMVTPDLFRRWPDAAALASADPEELEAAIRSTGFYHNKAKALRGVGQMLTERYAGRVPETMDELLELPGVARKTANCVLGTWFGHNVGIVVDTHVGRLAERLRLAPTARDSKDAERIERDLMALFPQETRTWLAHALIEHGRRVCTARNPKCGVCPLATDCPSAFAAQGE
jgi:endonuclease III